MYNLCIFLIHWKYTIRNHIFHLIPVCILSIRELCFFVKAILYFYYSIFSVLRGYQISQLLPVCMIRSIRGATALQPPSSTASTMMAAVMMMMMMGKQLFGRKRFRTASPKPKVITLTFTLTQAMKWCTVYISSG